MSDTPKSDYPVIITASLGWAMARAEFRNVHSCMIHIITPGTVDDGCYSPPESVELMGLENGKKFCEFAAQIDAQLAKIAMESDAKRR